MPVEIPYFTLNNETKIPSVGLGCWMGGVGGGERVYEMCQKALKIGYRHIDTASGYQNEQEVGRAIRDSGIPREEIYLTTKLPNGSHHDVQNSFQESLKSLGVEYVDLYLMHWPQAVTGGSFIGNTLRPDEHPTFAETYLEMEKLLATGQVKSIGVSNFSIKNLTELLKHCSVVPAVNQVELHPCLPEHELKALCDKHGIHLTAYSPLGQAHPVFNDSAEVKEIASRYNITPTQVVLSWAVQRGTSIVPKSENEQRLTANITLVKLSDEDMNSLDEFHLKPGMHKSLLFYHQEDETVFGWKYEWLGWNMTKGGKVIPTPK